MTIHQSYEVNEKLKGLLSLKVIFKNHWNEFCLNHDVRDVEREEVEKMLSCKGDEMGGYMYCCGNCGKMLFIPFGCNSKLCSCCGKRHTDNWAKRLSKKILKGTSHRHAVLGMPPILWEEIRKNRKLMKIVMDVAAKTIKEMFSKTVKKEIEPGMIEVLHPFGRDLGFKPHVHVIVTEGGFDKQNKFVKLGNYINYDTFHRKWQYNLIKELRRYIDNGIIDICFRKYQKGFAAYIRPERIYSGKGMIRYILRYVRHPAIANSRIDAYNGEAVRFFFEDHDGNMHYKIMLIDDFISAIIQHIPEKNFRMVRYYGAYGRNKRRFYQKMVKHSVIDEKKSAKRLVICPDCYCEMEIIAYIRKPPDKDWSKITSWI